MPERPDLFAFILSLVRDPSLAVEAIGRIPPGGGSISAAREAATAVCRRRKRPIPLSPAAIDALERAAASRSAIAGPEALRLSLERVGRQDRSLLAMRYRKRMSLAQIARRVKNTVPKTQKALHRARLSIEKAAAP